MDVSSVRPSNVSFSCAIWLSLTEKSHCETLTPVYVRGCTVTPDICGRPTWTVRNCPALLPLVWICWNAVPTTTVGVVNAEPRAYFHQNPIESATDRKST